MNTPAFTVVCTARTLIEADLVIATLRNAGLHPVELDTFSHFSLAGADVSYHIKVPTPEVSAAKEGLSLNDKQEPTA